MRKVIALAALSIAFSTCTGAQDHANGALGTELVEASTLLSPAARAIQKIPLATPAEKVLPVSKADAAKLKPHLTLDEIRIYGQREPEDFTRPKRAPMLVFRDRLDRERPETPAESTSRYLCYIGLCGGIPNEVGVEERMDIRTRQSTTQLQAMRGTLQ